MKGSNIFIEFFLFTFVLLIVSCNDTESEKSDSLFVSMSSSHTNINFKNIIPEDELTNSFVYEYVYNGGGVAVGDINNDGLDDIYFISNLEENRLYLNQGNLKFKDISKISSTQGKRGWCTGANMVDINNDGLLDIYVSKSGPFGKANLLSNELFINKGENANGIPVFEEEAAKYGLNDTSNSIQSAFFDFDLDGDLDMYLMNHNPQTFSISGKSDVFSPLGDKFYVNENGKFIDKTKEVGIFSNAISYGLGIGVSDLNLDGWPDVYISNDYDELDYMYINQKNGTFKEVIKAATNHISNFAMGNDVADFDNDGFVDILTLDMVSEHNYGMKTSMASMNPKKFKKNVDMGRHYQYMYNTFQKHSTYIDSIGIPSFSDIAQISGISNTDWSWAPLLADFDNDGLKDVFITNGIKRDFRNKDFYASMQLFIKENQDALTNPKKIKSLIDRTPKRPQKNYFYKNNGSLNFTNSTDEWFPNATKTYSNGAAYADLDNDGDLDVVINNVDEKATILRNNSEVLNANYVNLEFTGLPKNTKGIGVKVLVYTNQTKQVFENYNARGYQSSMPPKVHVGLGEYTKIDSLLVCWPNNKVQKVVLSEINKNVSIKYNIESIVNPYKTEVVNAPFSLQDILPDLKHIENDYDDYEHQILLPHKLSQFGPAITVGDVNDDGMDDIYLGQSTGVASVLYIQNKNGKFIKKQTFNDDTIFEDVDAEFFDFDNDGDLDLYVASGGNEFEGNSSNYVDRLYENIQGKFIKRADFLPKNIHISSSKIRIKDFNKDGYPDVFVGGRHTPHSYPTPTSSYILMNQKGTFIDITEQSAPELQSIGMVTDATWTDYDGDGDTDLIVVGEWMSPTIFENTDDSFKKVSSNYLESISGWYYAIEPMDVDNDGDDDYLLGNLGENYKYKANSKEPFEMYYHDFDDNGKKDIVLGYYNFGELFPVRGKECSTQQVPNIKNITPSYHEFGNSTVLDIYGKDDLSSALHLTSYNFKSGVLKNNGGGDFEFKPFPDLAQLSSINDMLIKDVNNDGKTDVILAGNLFTSEIETPRNDAGYGLVLLNDDDFEFAPLNANKSGLFIPYDVKNLHWLTIKNQIYMISGNNDEKVSTFKLDID